LFCRFYASPTMGDLLDFNCVESLDPLVTLLREDVAGTRVTYQFLFPHFEEEYYIGLLALDQANNTGKIISKQNNINTVKNF
jgi:hypothetical protein